MPSVPLKHSTHPPLSLPLDALLSLFSLPPSPPPPCRRQPSSDRRIPPRPDYSTNDQFIFVSFTIRIRCSFSLLSSFSTKRLFGACIDLPVHASATDLRAAGETRRRLRPSAQGPFPPASLLPNEDTASVLASGTWLRLPPFLLLEPRGWRLCTLVARDAPLCFGIMSGPQSPPHGECEWPRVWRHISNPHMSNEISTRLTYSKVHRRSLSFCFDRPSRPAISRSITNFRLWEHLGI